MAKKKDRSADPVARERARVLDACERLGLDLVRFLYVDHGGVVRGKATSRSRLEERLATGIGLTVAMQAMSMLDELAPVEGLGPVGEVRLVPDTASFVALPWAPGAGARGSGGLADRRNAFWDASDTRGLSEVACHWIGGLLAHLPGLVALTCGSVISRRRLAPQTWSSAFVCWGMDNREAAVRVPSRMWGLDEASTNLALGAYIHAGLDGLRNKLDPGRPVDVDPAALSRRTRSRRGINRLPESLGAALDALEADELLMEALGPLRRTAYLAVKRSEVAAFAARDVAFECAQHAAKF
jgi:glutamine synthetase